MEGWGATVKHLVTLLVVLCLGGVVWMMVREESQRSASIGAAGAASAPSLQPAPPPASGTEQADEPQKIEYVLEDSPREALVYAPSAHQSDAHRPLVLAMSPGGDAVGMVRRWIPAARAVGWIVASTAVVRNGTPDAQDRRELAGLRDEVIRRFRADASRVVLDGFSGTGVGAYAQVLLAPGLYRGAIVENSHMGSWRSYGSRAQPGKHVYLFTRTDDFNAPATRELLGVMRSAGWNVEYRELAGSHAPMQPAELVEAARWIDGAMR